MKSFSQFLNEKDDTKKVVKKSEMSDKMRDIEGDSQSSKIRKEIEKETGKKTREYTQKSGEVTTGNFRGRKADRIKAATGGKKTGSLRGANLSFPGDRSGAYQATKSDIETRKGFSKNKPGGLKADETNKFVKTSVRKSRVDKLGGDIYDAPKFSQKKFDKSIGGAKKPTSTAAPGLFGKGDTKGQMNVKAMDKKAFKVTQPKDVKLPKSFRDFSQKLQDFKDRDIPGGPRKTTTTKPKTSSPSLTRQDVGMAPPDKPKAVKKPKVVKQSEISKKLKQTYKKLVKTQDSLIGKRQKLRSDTGEKDVGKIKKVNRKIRTLEGQKPFYKSAVKGIGNPNAPVVYNKTFAEFQKDKVSKKLNKLGKLNTQSPVDKVLRDIKRVKQAGPKKVKEIEKMLKKMPDDPRITGLAKKSAKKQAKIIAKPTPKITMGKPQSYSGGPTNYPKRGQVSKALGMSKETRSSWKTRAKATQFGAASGLYGVVKKYKQERAKGKSKVSSAVAGGLKGAARFAGTYGGAMLAKKFGGKKVAAGITGLIGGSIADRGYDVTSKTVNRIKNVFSPEKKSNNPPKVPPKKPIVKYTQDQKPRYDISGIVKSSKN